MSTGSVVPAARIPAWNGRPDGATREVNGADCGTAIEEAGSQSPGATPRPRAGTGGAVCIEICSGQAITAGENGVPKFDREKCVHCGACLWSCTEIVEDGSDRTNLELRAGAGGLHTVEN